MAIHNLKIDDEYLENLNRGIKQVEIRYNDRDYQRGDILRFVDWKGTYLFEITHIHSGLGLKENYVALSLVAVCGDGDKNA